MRAVTPVAAADIVANASAQQTAGDSDAAAEDTYWHAMDAAAATQEQDDASAAETQQLAIDAAEQTQMLADTAAETTYQVQLDSAAETEAIAEASASNAFSTAIDTALATQATADASAQHAYTQAIDPLEQQYMLAMGDANAAFSTATNDAYTRTQVALDNAAASAWTSWGNSTGNPGSIYEAATTAASYTYAAAASAIMGTANDTVTAAQNQWNHDVSGGWLTYQNAMADAGETGWEPIAMRVSNILTRTRTCAYFALGTRLFPGSGSTTPKNQNDKSD